MRKSQHKAVLLISALICERVLFDSKESLAFGIRTGLESWCVGQARLCFEAEAGPARTESEVVSVR